MENCTPIAFLPTRDNVNGKNIYRDLSNYSCSAEEKRFLAEEILDIHNLLELSNTNIKTGFGKNTCRGMCERYNLSRNTVSKWMGKVIENKEIMEYSGRPTALNDKEVDKLSKDIINANKTTNSILVSEFSEHLNQGAERTMVRAVVIIILSNILYKSCSIKYYIFFM